MNSIIRGSLRAEHIEPVASSAFVPAPSKQYFCSLGNNISIDVNISLILEKQQLSVYTQRMDISAWEVTTGLKKNNSVFFFQTAWSRYDTKDLKMSLKSH